MRWQGVARAVVALIGIGCAVTVYVMLRPRPGVTEAPAPAMLDNSATAASKGTTIKRLDETGRETFVMRADENLVMADGRTVFKGNMRLNFARGGVKYTVTADEAESSGKSGPTGEEPSKIEFRKRVKMVGDDGFSVEAEDATYLGDEQRVTFPGAVAYIRDRMEGRGVGADLFMDRSVLWMYDQSHLTIKPEGSGGPVEITAKQIGLAQTEGYLRAVEGARLTRQGQQLSADALAVFFAEGTQNVRRIELVGKSNVRRTGRGQQPDMRGDNIDLDFAPEAGVLSHARMDGAAVLTLRDDAGTTRVTGAVIDLNLGSDGETLTRLESTGPTELVLPRVGETPAKTILSGGLVAEGADPKGLDRAVFSGGVQYRESLPATRGQAAAVRLAISQSLVLGLGGALNQVNIADFRQGFCFAGPLAPTVTDLQCSPSRMLPARGTMEDTMVAAADEGRYDAKAETLRLRSTGPALPRVVNQEIEIKGREVDIDIKQETIDARRTTVAGEQVDSVRRPTAARAKDAGTSGLFEGGKPISGKANSLKYSKATGMATYSGEVLVAQEGASGQVSVLRANDVRIDNEKQDIEANGNVRSTLFIEGAPDEAGKKGPTRTQINGGRMIYTEALRTAVYTGAARMESGEAANKQSLEAPQITLEMHPQQRALKRLVAVTLDGTGIVLAKLPDERQTTGLQLTYDADKDWYEVKGTPAQFVSRSTTKGPDMCDVGIGTTLEFQRGAGLSNVKNEKGAVGRAGERRCVEVLK